MIAPIARILARYLSGALISYGALASHDAPAIGPDLALIIGAALGALSEAAYASPSERGGVVIQALLSALWRRLLALGGLILIYLKGRKDASDKAKARASAAYRETRERMDDADIHGNDPDAGRRWLHERGSSGDL